MGKTAAETVTMLREAFKEEALSQARVYEWFTRFKRGDMSLEDQPRSGRPSTCRTNENIKKNSRCNNVWLSLNNRRAGSGVLWSDCMMLCEENAPNCGGQVSGFCIMTTLPPTQHWECGSFSWKTGWQQPHTRPIPWTWHPVIFFLFPRMKRDLKGKRSQNVEEVREKTTEALKAITLQVSELFWTMEKVVG